MPPELPTRLTELVGVRHPIVQTGMGYVSGARLTAATADAGGLGVIASATMSLDELRSAIREVRRRTSAPFGVNLRADATDVRERVGLAIAESVRVVSFALAPRRDLISRLRDAGVVTIPSVGALRHAEKVAAWGADAVIVQGGEGGGHTGAIPTSLLLPQVVDAVDIPVVAAGGFFDGRGLVAALAYGAAGVAMGTRFLLTSDSPVDSVVKRAYLDSGVTDTVVTTQVDGLPHRVLRTRFVDRLERSGRIVTLANAFGRAVALRRLTGMSWPALLRDGLAARRSRDLSWAQALMAANTPVLLRAAMVDGRADLGVMSAGQVVGLIDDVPSCAELIDRIMTEAQECLTRLTTAR
ncbi:nitronate monooxygenase [Salinispora arenicola]|uniref:NAD(P)H-dependent flavin oxidoreductase n=1 Tax=Salinispora arenicola TaxID=168697 RepID=UPI0014314BC8|nr:nitronate monooxygenase [Salinispora arenicola]NIL41835.1 nitronate monooxygenase [Salinispora arenicola]